MAMQRHVTAFATADVKKGYEYHTPEMSGNASKKRRPVRNRLIVGVNPGADPAGFETGRRSPRRMIRIHINTAINAYPYNPTETPVKCCRQKSDPP